MATEEGMVLTVLHGEVASEQWADVTRAFAAATEGGLPAELISTSLVQETSEPTRRRIVTLWRSRADLEAYLRSVETPGEASTFRAAGVEPASLRIFTVVDHVAHGS